MSIIQKGEVRNPNGRGKGTPNKTTKELKAFWKAFLENNQDRIQEMFDNLENDKDRLQFIAKMSEFVIAKERHNDITGLSPEPIEVRISDFRGK